MRKTGGEIVSTMIRTRRMMMMMMLVMWQASDI